MNQQKAIWINQLSNIMLWGTIILGIVIRIVVLIQNRSIYLDEANLAHNILSKPFTSFFQSLDHDQFSPPLFLCIEKCFANIFGFTEWSLRLFPLLCGIATILVFYQLLKKLIPYTVFQWYPIALMSLSPLFIRYATEIKQYSVDAFLTVTLIYLALNQKEIYNWKGTLTWMFIGSLSIWLSMPIIFILASIGIYFLWYNLQHKNYAALPFLITIGITWLLNFGIYYALILRQDMNLDLIQGFHQEYFFPLFPKNSAEVQQALNLLRKLIGASIGTTFIAIALGSFSILFGSYHLYKEEKRVLVLFILPIFSTLVASYMGMYSILPRLILFLLPLLILLSGFGVLKMFEPLNKPLRLLLLLFLSLILANQKGYNYLWQPLALEELRPVMTALKKEVRTDELVYVHHEAVAAYRFYTEWIDDKASFTPQNEKLIFANWDTPLEQIKTQNHKKVWIVFSHTSPEVRANLMAQMSRMGTLKNKIEAEGAAAYSFTLF